MFLLSRPAGAADLDATAIRTSIDGVYILEEWNTDAGAFRPPKVDGRLVFYNGTLVDWEIPAPDWVTAVQLVYP